MASEELDPQEQALQEAEDRAFPTRRAVMQAALGMGAGLSALSTLYIGAGLIPKKVLTPQNEPLKPGDVLVFALGAKKDQPIEILDLPLGGPFQLAYPMDPASKVVRSQEPNNTLLLLRLGPGDYAPEVAKHTVQGMVAYSAVCTHLGCIVSLWDAQQQRFRCPCHNGLYDPKTDQVVGGPPPRPIAQLPIEVKGGQLVVAGAFLGPLGVQS